MNCLIGSVDQLVAVRAFVWGLRCASTPGTPLWLETLSGPLAMPTNLAMIRLFP